MATLTLPFAKPDWFRGKQIDDDERERLERERAELRERRRLQAEQVKEAKYFARAIPAWLANLGYAWWYRKSDRDLVSGHYKPIRFNRVQIAEDAYFFRIDTKHLPRGVFIHNLSDEMTLASLTASCQSKVVFFQDDSFGSWYMVETKYGRGNIPTLVGYAEMLKMLADDAPPMVFPLGMGENQKQYFGDLDKMINLLIGGTKGGGKSNAANVLLCTLLKRNAPQNLRVFLTDLKGGIEFADYSGIPHLGGDVRYLDSGDKGKLITVANDYKLKPGQELLPPLGQEVYTEPFEVIPMLAYVEAELARRANLLAGHAKKIATNNNKYPDKSMSYWIVVIDELATLMENATYKKRAVASLSEIARKGRAVGIYLILATQTPTSDIIPQQIGNNMDSRLAFRTGSGVSSGILLGSGEYDAEKLPNIPGRFIWKWGGDKIQMQAPLIHDATIHSIIASVRAGEYQDPREIELEQKATHLFEFSLRNCHGECHTKNLHQFLKPDGYTRKDVESILDRYEHNPAAPREITLDDNAYYLAQAIKAKNISRWLVATNDWGKKHPHPEFNWALIEARNPKPDETNGQVTGKIENSNSPIATAPICDLATLAELPFEPLAKAAAADCAESIEIEDSDIELSVWDAYGDDANEDLPNWLCEKNQKSEREK